MGRTSLLITFALMMLTFAAMGEEPAARPYWRTIVRGTHGMVAAEHPLQAMAGLDALKAGGNAIDAALAVYYMTSVVEQHQSGLGSDCYVLAYIAKEKKVVFFNGTGSAPKLATLETYRKLGDRERDKKKQRDAYAKAIELYKKSSDPRAAAYAAELGELLKN